MQALYPLPLLALFLWQCTHNVQSGSPQLQGPPGSSETAPDVESLVKSKLRDLDSCYEQEKQANPKAKGKALFSFAIEINGKTSGVRLLASTLKSPMMEGCLVNKIESWQFPTQAKVVLIHYPFAFGS